MFTTKVPSGGGGGFPFGIDPPAPSKTFKDLGNTSSGDSTTDDPLDKGRRAPVIDTKYAALQLPVAANGAAGVQIARGQQPSAVADWTTDLSTFTGSTTFARAYYYHTGSNVLYILMSDAANSWESLWKMGMSSVGGTAFLIWRLGLRRDCEVINGAGNTIEPVDPANPNSSDWIVTYPDSGSPTVMQAAVVSNAAGIGTIDSTTPFKVDAGGTNQSVQGNGGYVTADRTMMISNIGTIVSPVQAMSTSFVLSRGASRRRVIIPQDESWPATRNAVYLDSNVTNSRPDHALIQAWGDSVIVLADARIGASVLIKARYGRNTLDRVDFDRALQGAADFHNMPDGEVYY